MSWEVEIKSLRDQAKEFRDKYHKRYQEEHLIEQYAQELTHDNYYHLLRGILFKMGVKDEDV